MEGGWAAGRFRSQSSPKRAERAPESQQPEQEPGQRQSSPNNSPQQQSGSIQKEPIKQLDEQVVRYLRDSLVNDRFKRLFIDKRVSCEALQRLQAHTPLGRCASPMPVYS